MIADRHWDLGHYGFAVLLMAAVLQLALLPSAKAEPIAAELTEAETRPRAFLATPLGVYDRAIAFYEEIAAADGWQPLPIESLDLQPGMRDELVRKLRIRLAVEGDLMVTPGQEASDDYDSAVTAALDHFQRRHGLRRRGSLDPYTLDLMNVPVAERLNSLRHNRQRLAALQGTDNQAIPERHIFVNIPEAELEAVAGDVVIQHYDVATGSVNSPTPLLTGKINAIRFFPSWTSPVSVARRSLWPELRSDPNYLEKNGFRVLLRRDRSEVDASTIDWDEVDINRYIFHQLPGPRNAMGLVKIEFPNDQLIFLHGSAHKSVYDDIVRSVSAGCIRVDNIGALAAWLLSGNEEWSPVRVETVLAEPDSKTFRVRLKRRVPLILGYFTAWVEADGGVSFRPDSYALDSEIVASKPPQKPPAA